MNKYIIYIHLPCIYSRIVASLNVVILLSAVVFKVATLKKTRHENLVLFMGACMTPPKLALVTRSVGQPGYL